METKIFNKRRHNKNLGIPGEKPVGFRETMKRQQSLVLITGATRGLGNRIAHLLIRFRSHPYRPISEPEDERYFCPQRSLNKDFNIFDLAETELLSGFIKEIIETWESVFS